MLVINSGTKKCEAIIDGNTNVIKHMRHLVVDTGTMVGNEMTQTVIGLDGSGGIGELTWK